MTVTQETFDALAAQVLQLKRELAEMQQVLEGIESLQIEANSAACVAERAQAQIEVLSNIVGNKHHDGPPKLSDRRAGRLMPDIWAGRGDQVGFREYAEKVHNWMSALYSQGTDLLVLAEKEPGQLRGNHMKVEAMGTEVVDVFRDVETRLYQMLVATTKGEAVALVRNVGQLGFRAWKNLTQYYDPKQCVDATVERAKLLQPAAAKSIQDARMAISRWESEVLTYEARFPEHPIADIDKIVALKQLIPPQITGNKFVGEQVAFQELKNMMAGFLADRTIADATSDKKRTRQEHADIDAVDDREATIEKIARDMAEITGSTEDLCASIIKQNTNQSTKRYDNTGGRQDQRWRQTAPVRGQRRWQRWNPGQQNARQKDWQAQGQGRNQSCYKCGKPGNFARDCRSRSAWAVEDEGDDEEYEDHGDMLCGFIGDAMHDDMICSVERRIDDERKNRGSSMAPHNRFTPLGEEVDVRDETSDSRNEIVCQLGKCPGWTVIEAAVDSAAVDNIMPRNAAPEYPMKSSPGSRANKGYVAANGTRIPNLGEKTVRFRDGMNKQRAIKFQVADVARTLVSSGKLVDMGHDVHLTKKNPRVITSEGETIPLRRSGKLFIMDLWIKCNEAAADFRRQG